jgi:hypothetical protein
LRKELSHSDARRGERSAEFFFVRYGLRQLVGGFLSGAPPETGEAEGLVINLSGVSAGRSSASANPAVGREEAPDKSL